jgi:hypothetical protein
MLNDKYIYKIKKIRTYIFKTGMLLLALVLLMPGSFAADIASSSKIVAPGQSFDLNVSIDPVGMPIAGAEIDFAFNRSIIKINSVTEGNLFNRNGASTFFNRGNINNSIGSVTNIFDAIIGKSNVSTMGTFIIINITATGSSGTSRIDLSNVKVSDTNGSPVALNLTNGSVRINNPPVLAAIGNKMVDEGQTLNFTLSATDPDVDVLTFTASNLPAGASFDPVTRFFNWTPDYDRSGTYPNVHFEVSDGFYTVYENITVTVNNVNRAPTLTLSPANGSIFNETDTILINITANDPDNDLLGYIIKIDGIQVSNSSGYKWKTNYKSSGFHIIEGYVTDGKATVNQTNTIYIRNEHPSFDQ